ncbi:MAG: ThiF family adenylyltransferase [Candidatus Peribacteria bacterium]|jgi:molybdopterin/thiamine biosynthesis adenylyltransferase|nr:ThiF family adenylyltransferase [Candidatus Peribacteria bacterium]
MGKNLVNTIRSYKFFNPEAFGGRTVVIIGAGAIGSHLIEQLARSGIWCIIVYDFDIVEEHNLHNQAFDRRHIGIKKVNAMMQIVAEATGLELEIYDEKVDGSQEMGEVVFLVVDSFDARRQIFERALEDSFTTKVVFDARMGATSGQVHMINPNNREDCIQWKKTLYNDNDVVVENSCRSKEAVGATALGVVCHLVWQFFDWFAWTQGNGPEPVKLRQFNFSGTPTMFTNRDFEGQE